MHEDSPFNFKKKSLLNDFYFNKKLSKNQNISLSVLVITLIVLFLVYLVWFHPPKDFPVKTFVNIEKGMTIDETSIYLEDIEVIRSAKLMRFLYRTPLGNHTLIAGDYFLDSRLPLWTIIRRFATGNYGIENIKVTIPEGVTLVQIADVLERSLPEFNRRRFLLLSKGLEGYLFPDTYFFSPGIKEENIIEEMRQTFEGKIDPLLPDIAVSKRSIEDIVIMASIIERETITTESKYVVSGILWKRIESGMRLQVDAVFSYLLGKGGFELTKKDLQIDSPYNTYKYEGLPPGPIASPGIESIKASVYPDNNPYWFYLSDFKSNMHYAKTYAEHLANVNRYLK